MFVGKRFNKAPYYNKIEIAILYIHAIQFNYKTLKKVAKTEIL
ncbi:hypothetical protein IIU_06138 [Bacillus cereus VD133]|uniref:Uncharacterized protein n=1 Tax=Bacillus cereus VD133 TaxID=1053233 RepID=A0A9W5PKU8_BACCE|nr:MULTISPECIES: hypothetical protein [Bacillus cereus group]EOO25461.1 hypothetical protein IIU_06138 [Bacillus cereus VD133]